MDIPLSKVENLLPGVISKTIMGISLLLSGVLYTYYPDLPKSWLAPTEEQRFLWRLLVPISLMLFGAISLIASLIYTFHKFKKNIAIGQAAHLDEVNQTLADFQKQLSHILQLHAKEKEQIIHLHSKETERLINIFEPDLITARDRIQVISSLDPRLVTPQLMEEMKVLITRVQMFARFSELFTKFIRDQPNAIKKGDT